MYEKAAQSTLFGVVGGIGAFFVHFLDTSIKLTMIVDKVVMDHMKAGAKQKNHN